MAEHCATSWADIDITRDEVNTIGKALKNEEFRKLLIEYADEINDPANKKLYQEEIIQLEKERGVDVTFINPEPGYVIKTSVDGQKKAFINVCKNINVGKPVSEASTKSGARGLNWSLPYSQAPPREDLDKKGDRCVVYDVVFHPDTLRLADSNAKFRAMLSDTALDAVENSFHVKVDRNNLKFPKMHFKGISNAAVVRKKSANAPVKDEDEFISKLYPPTVAVEEVVHKNYKPSRKENKHASKDCKNTYYTIPKYSIIHRCPVDIQNCTNDKASKINASIPKELVIEVYLPLLKSSEDLVLDVMEKGLSLVSKKYSKYKLELQLPYPVHEEMGTAKFDKALQKLVVILPVKYRVDVGKEDSGVECDPSWGTSESSSGDDYLEYKEESDDALRTISVLKNTNDESYRTNVANEAYFLNPDIHYSLPNFTCNVVDDTIAYILHVKNVEASSVEHRLLQESRGAHFKFMSVGSGFFPIHHSFCIKLPPNISFHEDGLSVETWDNNVIVQIQLDLHDTLFTEYFAGISEDSLAKHDLTEPAALGKRLKELQSGADINLEDDGGVNIDITRNGDQDMVVEIFSEKSTSMSNGKLETATKASPQKEAGTSPFDNRTGAFSNHVAERRQQKYRLYSESSGDEMNLSPTKKGILKYNGRVCRSLSESSVDEYAWSSSLDLVTHSGSESCIPEEGEDESGTKKTVRFNDVVSQKTFRANSSILGQKKKNQRKLRNKKRAHDRRTSESENSESEADRERGKERESKTEDEISESLSHKRGQEDENLQISDVTKEFDDLTPNPPALPTLAQEEQSLNEVTEALNMISIKNKKKNRKRANSQKQGNEKLSLNGEFRSDLIFDLDM
uniref:Protein kintoun n=1 Tax=Timema californicum TaxID=61474 RepID=A0A7R9PAL0_TIMCA|nr:unnamed protein product [Timema californicum]